MTKETGGSAFPLFDGSAQYGGMTLRDWFAGMAITGVVGDERLWINDPIPANTIAYQSYAIADAMIAERNKQ